MKRPNFATLRKYEYFSFRRLRIYGAPVFVHWSVLPVAVLVMCLGYADALSALLLVLSYLGVILLHEAGHACVARRLGYRVDSIILGCVHGECRVDLDDEDPAFAVIAWGGVLAQFLVAVPLIAVHQIIGPDRIGIAGPLVAILGYLSAIVAVINMVPSPRLDGGHMWNASVRDFGRLFRRSKPMLRRVK